MAQLHITQVEGGELIRMPRPRAWDDFQWCGEPGCENINRGGARVPVLERLRLPGGGRCNYDRLAGCLLAETRPVDLEARADASVTGACVYDWHAV